MTETNSNTTQDSKPAAGLTVGEFRVLIREGVESVQSAKGHGEDRLLTAEDAAGVLSVSPDWLYRNAKTLPFARKIGEKMLRFSSQGMQKWLNTRKPS